MEIQVGDNVRVTGHWCHFVPDGYVVPVVELRGTMSVIVLFSGVDANEDEVENMRQMVPLSLIEKA